MHRRSHNPLLILIAIFVYFAAETEAQSSELQAISEGTRVSDVMITTFATLGSQARVGEAVELLLSTSQSEFPVVDEAGRFEGLMTREGIVRAMRERGAGASVRDGMRRDVPTLDEHSSIDASLKLMQEASVPAVPIIDRNRRVVGLMNYETIGWKLKKPVKRAFLDFSTVHARHFFCCEEVRLNRRLARETYRGVKPLYADFFGNLTFEGRGTAVDWLVEMRRLPEADMLDCRIKARDLAPTELLDVAEKLVRFYEQCQPQTADDYVRHLLDEHERTRITLLRPEFDLATGDITALLDGVGRGLQSMCSTIEERIKSGNLVEGHGDLRPEHICLVRPPQVIDCLEFNRSMRLVDPYDEISYLALECEALGSVWIGPIFLSALERTFGNRPCDRLLALYGGFRALLRARLCLTHLLEMPLRRPEKWRPLALIYIEVAKARMSLFTT